MNPIVFRNVCHSYANRRVLDGFDLVVADGECLVLLGSSGSGKTTALRLVNRLVEPESGEVLIRDKLLTEWNATELRRSIGYVIQEAGLLPHLSVEQNISLVPRLLKWPEAEIRARLEHLLAVTEIDREWLARSPSQLSGGQRQRVAVARALAGRPSIVLFDEPFGALDPLTRDALQTNFTLLRHQERFTAVFVTHDVREALIVADRIAVLDGGKLQAVLQPDEFLASQDTGIRKLIHTAAIPERERA